MTKANALQSQSLNSRRIFQPLKSIESNCKVIEELTSRGMPEPIDPTKDPTRNSIEGISMGQVEHMLYKMTGLQGNHSHSYTLHIIISLGDIIFYINYHTIIICIIPCHIRKHFHTLNIIVDSSIIHVLHNIIIMINIEQNIFILS